MLLFLMMRMAPEEQIAEAAELNFWKARSAVFDKNLRVIYNLIQQKSCLTPSKKKYIVKSYFLLNDFLLNLILFIAPVGPGALHVTDAGYQMAICSLFVWCVRVWSTHTRTARIWMYIKRPDKKFRTIQWCHNLVFWKLDENMRKAQNIMEWHSR